MYANKHNKIERIKWFGIKISINKKEYAITAKGQC